MGLLQHCAEQGNNKRILITSSISPTTSGRRQWMLLLTLWTGIFCNYACYSVIAPFFPRLARQKGLTAEEYSLVFGSYSFSQILFSCIAGKCLMATSTRFVIVSSLFLTGGSTILFGCMEMCPGGSVFFALCCCIRFVEGAGFAAYLTSALATVIRTFPSHPGYYVGLTETVVTIAMICGPPLGSFLYTLGGYYTPFVSIGMIVLASCALSFAIITDDGVEKSSHGRRSSGRRTAVTIREFAAVLRMRAGIATLGCVTCNVTADAFVLISLSDHLQQFSLSPMEIGGIYLCLFLSYGLSSPAAGRLADRAEREFLLQSCGCFSVAIAFSLIGPASFLPWNPSLVLIVSGLLLKGIGAGPLISCSFSAALRAAKRAGLPDDFRTYSLISTLVSFSIPLGNLLGGLTTGALVEKLKMPVATTVYAALFVVLGIVCFGMHLADHWPPTFLVRLKDLWWKVIPSRWQQSEEELMDREDPSPINEKLIAMVPMKNKSIEHPLLARLVKDRQESSTYYLLENHDDRDIRGSLCITPDICYQNYFNDDDPIYSP